MHLGAMLKALRGISKESCIFGTGGIVICPDENGEVTRVLKNCFLEARKRPMSLTVNKGHVHVENTQETVGHIFDTGGFPLGRPRHPAGNGYLGKSRWV